MLHQGLLYCKLRLRNRREDTYQFVVPREFRKTALSLVYDIFGHLGIDRSTVLMIDEIDGLKCQMRSVSTSRTVRGVLGSNSSHIKLS